MVDEVKVARELMLPKLLPEGYDRDLVAESTVFKIQESLEASTLRGFLLMLIQML